MKLGICIIVSILLSGCSSLFPIKVTDPRTGIEYTVPTRLQHVPGIKQLAEACATKAGRVVHRTVEVDGYYRGDMVDCDQACWRDLTRSHYDYFEFNVTKVEPWNFLKKTGLWRISKQDLDDARCEEKPTSYVKRIADREGWPMDFCLAFERIDQIESRYESGWSGFNLQENIDGVDRISLGKIFFRDRVSKEELGYSISATLFLGKDVVSSQRSFGCSSVGIKPFGMGTGTSLRYEVLKQKAEVASH